MYNSLFLCRKAFNPLKKFSSSQCGGFPFYPFRFEALCLPFHKLIFDKGSFGEFYCFRKLEKWLGYKKLFANVYLPKNEEGGTTEIDVMMITQNDLHVRALKTFLALPEDAPVIKIIPFGWVTFKR